MKKIFAVLLSIVMLMSFAACGEGEDANQNSSSNVSSEEDKKPSSDKANFNGCTAVDAGGVHSVGLKPDGTAVAIGYNYHGQCNVSGWTDIVAVSAGHGHTVGLKSDGTVVAVGRNADEQCNVSGLEDVVAISAGTYNTIGLKSDGTVVASHFGVIFAPDGSIYFD